MDGTDWRAASWVSAVAASSSGLGVGEQRLPGGRRGHRAAGPLEQPDAERPLEPPDGLADRGLGEPQVRGGPGEAAVLGHPGEAGDVAKGGQHARKHKCW